MKNKLRYFYAFFICALFGISINGADDGIFQDKPEKATFVEQSVQLPTKIGAKQYISNELILPGQIRISRAGVQEKVKEALAKEYVKQVGGVFENRAFNNGRSIIPDGSTFNTGTKNVTSVANALPIVLITVNNQIKGILLDGHHDFGANKAAGGSTIFIEVKDDLTQLAGNELWQTLEDKGYIYPYNLQGQKIVPLPTSFDALEDDAYRFFVKLAAFECKNPETKIEEAKPGTKNLKYPLWVKWKDKKFNPREVIIGDMGNIVNPPFIEFKVADQLYTFGKQYGFDYKPGDETDATRFGELIEKARTLLKEHPVFGFNIIQQKQDIKQIANGNPCDYVYVRSYDQGPQTQKRPEAEMPRVVQPTIGVTEPIIPKPDSTVQRTKKPLIDNSKGPQYEYAQQINTTIINNTANPISIFVRFGGYQQDEFSNLQPGQEITLKAPRNRPADCGDLFVRSGSEEWQLVQMWLCESAVYSIARYADKTFKAKLIQKIYLQNK